MFARVETGHADMFELKSDEGGRNDLRDRIKARGKILIVAVPEDEGVAAVDFGAGAEPEEKRPRLGIQGEAAKSFVLRAPAVKLDALMRTSRASHHPPGPSGP
jgi:hypothetical protein